jgi:hypothetical protein
MNTVEEIESGKLKQLPQEDLQKLAKWIDG